MIKKMSSSIVAILFMVAMTLTACTSQPTAGIAQGNPGNNQTGAPADVQGNKPGFTISPETKLVIGTLKLEGTAQAVTVDQAKILLPLWSNAQKLASDSASEDMQKLIDQIKAAMTTDQLAAIDKIEVTPENMRTMMNDLGIKLNGPDGGQGQGEDNLQGTRPAPQGTRTPPQGTRTPGMGNNRVNPALLEAIISMLTQKAGA